MILCSALCTSVYPLKGVYYSLWHQQPQFCMFFEGCLYSTETGPGVISYNMVFCERMHFCNFDGIDCSWFVKNSAQKNLGELLWLFITWAWWQTISWGQKTTPTQCRVTFSKTSWPTLKQMTVLFQCAGLWAKWSEPWKIRQLSISLSIRHRTHLPLTGPPPRLSFLPASVRVYLNKGSGLISLIHKASVLSQVGGGGARL